MLILDRYAHRYAPALVSVMIALGSSSASAISVVLLSQDRSIHASASGCGPSPEEIVCGSDSDSDAAVGFDVFDSAVSASAPNGSAFASQLSTLTSTLISASVHTNGFGSWFADGLTGSGSARSVFRVAFSAAEAVPYTIQGSLLAGELSRSGSGAVTIALRVSGGGVLWETNGGSGLPSLIEFGRSGTLAPGDYILEASAFSAGSAEPAFNSSGGGVADFSFEFSIVPEPSTAMVLGLGLALLGLRRVGDRRHDAHLRG
jgi:hypothetical protein